MNLIKLIIPLLLIASSACAEPKIATINFAQVRIKHPLSLQLREYQRNKKKEWTSDQRFIEREKLDARRDEILEQAQKTNLTKIEEDALREELKELKNRKTEVENALLIFLRKKNDELNAHTAEQLRRINKDMIRIVQQYSKENNYDFLFDKEGLSNSRLTPVIYIQNETDITDDILKILEAMPAQPLNKTDTNSP